MQKKEGRKYHSTSLTAKPIAKQVLFTVWGNDSKVQSTRHIMHISVNNIFCKAETLSPQDERFSASSALFPFTY